MPSSRLSSALPTGAHPDFVDAQIEHSPFAVVVDVRSPDMFFARGNLRTTLVLRGGQSIVRVWRSSRARLGGVAVFRAPALVVAATTSIE